MLLNAHTNIKTAEKIEVKNLLTQEEAGFFNLNECVEWARQTQIRPGNPFEITLKGEVTIDFSLPQ